MPTLHCLALAEPNESAWESEAFSHRTEVELAGRPHEEAPVVPESFRKPTYRQINYQQDAAIWGDSRTEFNIQLFASGFLCEKLMDIDVVEIGRTYPLKVTESSFRVPDISG